MYCTHKNNSLQFEKYYYYIQDKMYVNKSLLKKILIQRKQYVSNQLEVIQEYLSQSIAIL